MLISSWEATMETYRCIRCQGGGYVRCPKCNEEQNDHCEICDGSGEMGCPNCDGRGRIDNRLEGAILD